MFGISCCCVDEGGRQADTVDINQVSVVVDSELPGPEATSVLRVDSPREAAPAAEPAPAPQVVATPAPATATANSKSQDITINIMEPAGDLGLEIGADLNILRVRDGYFKTWNEKNPSQAVGHNDKIISVNGSTSRDEMTSKLQKPGNLVVVVRKAVEFTVVLNKSGESPKIGLDVVHSGTTSLHIKSVRAGMVEDHNKICSADQKIEPGDRIVCICGVRGDSQAMLEQIKKSQVLDMVVSRTR